VTLYDRVSLEADPFIETLAGTFVENEARHASSSHGAPPLPTIFESTSASDLAATADLALDDVLGTQTEAASDQEHHVVQEAAATRTDNDNHIAHDAFLLNIPSESADGEMTDHFVLALPEIHADSDESVASTMSQVSEQPFPILQKAWSFLSEDLFLPSDIVSIQLEAHLESAVGDVGTVASSIKGEPSIVASTIGGGTFAILQAAELNLEVVVKRQVPVIGYIILISGLVALASVGAALDLQSGPSPLMKTLWRFNATSIVLSPLVVKSFCVDGLPDLTRRQVYMLPCAGAAYAYMCAAFVVALDMTTMANAFVLSNMTSLVIIFGRVLFRLPVLQMEGAGAIIGFTGAFICAQAAPLPAESGDGGLQTNFDDASIVMLGNAIALSASFGTAVYLIFAKSLRTSMDIFVFMFSIMSIAAICLLLYMVTSGEFFTWDMHPNHGIFGWLRLEHDRLFLDLYMAIICNCIGTTGYIAVMKYFEPIVPASVMLMEPVVGSLLGVLAGTATMPGAQTWIGDAIVAAGTFLVIYSGAKKTEKIDAAEALRPSTVGGDDASTMVSLLKSVKSGQSKQRKLSEDQTGIVSIPGSTKSVTKVIWEN
jgi:drug/metabolite transporter (DMT)-like permease